MSNDNSNPIGWGSVVASLTGSGITIAQINQYVTFGVGVLTAVYTAIKIVQALRNDARERKALKRLMDRLAPTSPGDLKE